VPPGKILGSKGKIRDCREKLVEDEKRNGTSAWNPGSTVVV
jgi:hypothetical protein